MNITYARLADTRTRIVADLTSRRARGAYRVIDVGGEGAGWTRSVIDALVDIRGDDPVFTFDICSRSAWEPLLIYVKQHGLFDYAICTHTLEDLYDPCVTLDLLPRIACSGVVTCPSLRTEFSRHENKAWLGNIHHRWLVDQEDGALLLAPKLGFLEQFKGLDIREEAYEIVFEWSEHLPWRMVSNNYFEHSDQIYEIYNELIARAQRL